MEKVCDSIWIKHADQKYGARAVEMRNMEKNKSNKREIGKIDKREVNSIELNKFTIGSACRCFVGWTTNTIHRDIWYRLMHFVFQNRHTKMDERVCIQHVWNALERQTNASETALKLKNGRNRRYYRINIEHTTYFVNRSRGSHSLSLVAQPISLSL